MTVDDFRLLDDDRHFESLDEHFDELPHKLRHRSLLPAMANSSSVPSPGAAALADGPLRGRQLPGGPSALLLHGRADCHPWEAAARWHDGQRICWPCLEQILTNDDAPALVAEPGA